MAGHIAGAFGDESRGARGRVLHRAIDNSAHRAQLLMIRWSTPNSACASGSRSVGNVLHRTQDVLSSMTGRLFVRSRRPCKRKKLSRAFNHSNNKGHNMKSIRSGRAFFAIGCLLTATFAGVVSIASVARADEDNGDRDSESRDPRIQRGLDIAPVPLNLRGRNRDLVGLGSYIVNAVADCNGCHTAGPPVQYAPGGNPYFKGNPPAVVNQKTYLSGGSAFGPLFPGTPVIVSRNLTPDKSRRAEGGRTWPEFREIIRTGVDLDHLHPNCSPTVTTNCFPQFLPFDGNLLQVMPWPVYRNMSDHELRAIYEYLSSIPCIEGPPTGVLHNDCG